MENSNAVQNRAERYFKSVGRFAPNAAVNGDMGWEKSVVKKWASVVNNWFRVKQMGEQRLHKSVYKWAEGNAGSSSRNARYSLYKQFEKSGTNYMFGIENHKDISKRFVTMQVQDD